MISISTADYKKQKEQEAKEKATAKPVLKVVKRVITYKHEIKSTTPPPKQEPPTQPVDNNTLKDLEQQAAMIFKDRAQMSSTIYKTVYGKDSNFCIDIGSVLNKIDQYLDPHGEVKTFSFRYLKADGVVGELLNCRKNVKDPKRERIGPPQKGGKFDYTLKERGVILLYSDDEEKYRNITVACIFEFKDHKDHRWTQVRH